MGNIDVRVMSTGDRKPIEEEVRSKLLVAKKDDRSAGSGFRGLPGRFRKGGTRAKPCWRRPGGSSTVRSDPSGCLIIWSWETTTCSAGAQGSSSLGPQWGCMRVQRGGQRQRRPGTQNLDRLDSGDKGIQGYIVLRRTFVRITKSYHETRQNFPA